MATHSVRKLKPPPDVKVLEAAGAIGDGRIALSLDGNIATARVHSSTGERSYMVAVRLPGDRASRVIYAYSDDNGTRYRGYVGYPIIAVLMLAGVLPRNRKLEEGLRGIPWKALNERFKKYSATKEYALKAASRHIPPEEASNYISQIMSRLRTYTIYYDPTLASRRP